MTARTFDVIRIAPSAKLHDVTSEVDWARAVEAAQKLGGLAPTTPRLMRLPIYSKRLGRFDRRQYPRKARGKHQPDEY